MIGFLDLVLICSLAVIVCAYVRLSRIDGSYVNVLLPSLIVSIPASFVFPWIYMQSFGIEASRYALFYVYLTIAVENVVFVYGYRRGRKKILRIPTRLAFGNFRIFAWLCLGTALLLYFPLLLRFRGDLLHPRQIYEQTRTGGGAEFYISGTFAYLAIIFALFSRSLRAEKITVTIAAIGVLLLHGSKGYVLNAVFLLVLFYVYGKGRRITFLPALVASCCIGLLVFALFAATMTLGEGPGEALDAISQYSNYAENAMMVIDDHYPLQYGRLTWEANTLSLIPRILMPNKPKNIGVFRLDDYFYPQSFDLDQGVPDFGIGVQYADFGMFAIIYLSLCSLLNGWLAGTFVNRLRLTGHPADFFMVVFLAGVQLFPVGGTGWLLPEAAVVFLFLRFTSRFGADRLYREKNVVFRYPDPKTATA